MQPGVAADHALAVRALIELHSELSEHDVIAGIVQIRAVSPFTRAATALEQYGLWPRAQEEFFGALKSIQVRFAPVPLFNVWEGSRVCVGAARRRRRWCPGAAPGRRRSRHVGARMGSMCEAPAPVGADRRRCIAVATRRPGPRVGVARRRHGRARVAVRQVRHRFASDHPLVRPDVPPANHVPAAGRPGAARAGRGRRQRRAGVGRVVVRPAGGPDPANHDEAGVDAGPGDGYRPAGVDAPAVVPGHRPRRPAVPFPAAGRAARRPHHDRRSRQGVQAEPRARLQEPAVRLARPPAQLLGLDHDLERDRLRAPAGLPAAVGGVPVAGERAAAGTRLQRYDVDRRQDGGDGAPTATSPGTHVPASSVCTARSVC